MPPIIALSSIWNFLVKGLNFVRRSCLYDRRRIWVYCRERDNRPYLESGLSLTWVDEAGFREHALATPELAYRLPQLKQRFAQGDRPCLVFAQGRLVHMAWWGLRDDIQADFELGKGCGLAFPEASALIYDCWTPPEARGQGYYPKALVDLSARILQKHERVWIYCTEKNLASRKGIEKSEFIRFAIMQRISWFHYFYRCSVSIQDAGKAHLVKGHLSMRKSGV